MADNKFILLPMKGSRCNYQLPRVALLNPEEHASMFNNVAVFPYAPANVVYAPISGTYEIANLYKVDKDDDDNINADVGNDFDSIIIRGEANGKRITVILEAFDLSEYFEANPSGEVKQGEALGVTRALVYKWSNLGMQIIPGNDKIPTYRELTELKTNPVVFASSELGGLVWPEDLANAKATGKQPDLANTAKNESEGSGSGDAGLGTVFAIGAGLWLAKKIFLKGK